MKTVLLCLHGWGGTKESFDPLKEALRNDPIEFLAPDLPGFGEEPEPSMPWTVDDYADWVMRWLMERQKNEETRLFLLGHSHGGRIAIKIAATPRQLKLTWQRPSHLFLCAAAGIRHPRHFKRIAGLALAKAGKTMLSLPGLRSLEPIGKKLLYKLVRVHDYERASEVMRQTLILVSREDLRPLLHSISVPTDLFWGMDDAMTPITDGLLMEERIPHATLHTYKGVRHGVHKDCAKEIAEVIRAALPVQSPQSQIPNPKSPIS